MDQSRVFPDGIDRHNLDEVRPGWNWLSLLVLSAVMLAALLGVFGGGKTRPLVATGAAAQLTVTTPRTIRNGEFFEMRVRIAAKQPIGKAVLVVPATLWRDMTVNTMIPAAAEEKAEGGRFQFHYGAMQAGDVLDVKIDGQINPPLFAGTAGAIELADDRRTIVAVPLTIRVLP